MITAYHSPLDSRIFYKEAISLKDAGYQVSVIGHTGNRSKEIKHGIEIIGLKKEQGSKLLSNLSLWRDLAKEALRVNADIYHCHEPESLLVGLYLKLSKHKKIIYDVHEYYKDYIKLNPRDSLQSKAFLWMNSYVIEPLFCRFLDGIIIVDEGMAERYDKLNPRVAEVPNFPKLNFFERPNPEPSNAEDIKSHFVVIYVGGMSEERGILELIKAVEKVSKENPQIRLLLFGKFLSGNFERYCREYIKTHRIEENIKLMGLVPYEDVPGYIRDADVGTVLLHPTERFAKTSYPIKLFEYMICRKPVIASNLPTLRKIVEENGSGVIVDPMDVNDIARAIKYLMDCPDQAERMGEKGRKAIECKYNWGTAAKSLLKIYKAVNGE